MSSPPPLRLHASGRLPLDRVLPVIGVALRYASSMMAGYMFWKGMGGGEWVEVWVQCDSRDLTLYRNKPLDCKDNVGASTTAYTSKRGYGPHNAVFHTMRCCT